MLIEKKSNKLSLPILEKMGRCKGKGEGSQAKKMKSFSNYMLKIIEVLFVILRICSIYFVICMV